MLCVFCTNYAALAVWIAVESNLLFRRARARRYILFYCIQHCSGLLYLGRTLREDSIRMMTCLPFCSAHKMVYFVQDLWLGERCDSRVLDFACARVSSRAYRIMFLVICQIATGVISNELGLPIVMRYLERWQTRTFGLSNNLRISASWRIYDAHDDFFYVHNCGLDLAVLAEVLISLC